MAVSCQISPFPTFYSDWLAKITPGEKESLLVKNAILIKKASLRLKVKASLCPIVPGERASLLVKNTFLINKHRCVP